jgi:hypothetical protein
MTHYCPQCYREYSKQFDKKYKSSELRWFTLGLLEALGRILMIPKFIIAVDGKIHIKAERRSGYERQKMQMYQLFFMDRTWTAEGSTGHAVQNQ